MQTWVEGEDEHSSGDVAGAHRCCFFLWCSTHVLDQLSSLAVLAASCHH